ncbi:uncharacterized protein EI90DRAFT_3073577 [Cantharellus anzutake]|uniref:uncharacterized protein n=1 Tax=Cantharellus anzutake TaxID=1750568 RepID=UPI0019079055|nr:uncharacterized protein EI90DRAFT_3073577 [Cantharellus anzutake]KAF8325249.1 hypothetical protein EI90DRAFT_3073577 [Cantharellus anzutake]
MSQRLIPEPQDIWKYICTHTGTDQELIGGGDGGSPWRDTYCYKQTRIQIIENTKPIPLLLELSKPSFLTSRSILLSYISVSPRRSHWFSNSMAYNNKGNNDIRHTCKGSNDKGNSGTFDQPFALLLLYPLKTFHHLLRVRWRREEDRRFRSRSSMMMVMTLVRLWMAR